MVDSDDFAWGAADIERDVQFGRDDERRFARERRAQQPDSIVCRLGQSAGHAALYNAGGGESLVSGEKMLDIHDILDTS